MKFQIFVGTDKLYYWHLKSANGEIICWSEGYTSLENAKKSIALVKKFAFNASIAMV